MDKYIPTPAEIAAACAHIRRQWSKRDRYRRREGEDFQVTMRRARHWQPAVIKLSEFSVGSNRHLDEA